MIGNFRCNTAIARLKSLVNQITVDVPDATVVVASLVVSTNSQKEQFRGGLTRPLATSSARRKRRADTSPTSSTRAA
ncbi:hypothetical protein [Streptomyces sp. NPDC002553]|uniref:hypothetical protein n=1 Tax=unclassified Streptomyces TaxID=2593676 RepID=UPI0033318644